MFGLSVNEFLGGLTFIIAMTKLFAALWVANNCHTQIRRLMVVSNRSYFSTIMRRDSVRISLGFVIMEASMSAVFFGRMPLRMIREMGNESLGDWWLSITAWWEIPATLGLMCGASMILWPAFAKFGTSRVIAIWLMIMVFILYLGAAITRVGAFILGG